MDNIQTVQKVLNDVSSKAELILKPKAEEMMETIKQFETRLEELEKQKENWKLQLSPNEVKQIEANAELGETVAPCLREKFNSPLNQCLEIYRNDVLFAAAAVVVTLAIMIIQSTSHCGGGVKFTNALSTAFSIAVLATSATLFYELTNKNISNTRLNLIRKIHVIVIGIRTFILVGNQISSYIRNLDTRKKLIKKSKDFDKENKELLGLIPENTPMHKQVKNFDEIFKLFMSQIECDSLVVITVGMLVGVMISGLPFYKNIMRHKNAFY